MLRSADQLEDMFEVELKEVLLIGASQSISSWLVKSSIFPTLGKSLENLEKITHEAESNLRRVGIFIELWNVSSAKRNRSTSSKIIAFIFLFLILAKCYESSCVDRYLKALHNDVKGTKVYIRFLIHFIHS